MRGAFFFILLISGMTPATVLDIPYAGGKQSGFFTITLDNGKAIHPDTVRLGTSLLVRPYVVFSILASCSAQDEVGLQLFPADEGVVMRRAIPDTNWAAYSTPQFLSSNVPLDSVPHMFGTYMYSAKARGFVIARPQSVECMTETYSFDSSYRQLIFSAGGGYYSKIQVVSFTETLPGPPPPFYQSRILNTITVRYIINDGPDLSDPVSIRPSGRLNRGASRFGARLELEHYNPLGIKLGREPGRFEPALAMPRKP